MNQNPSRWAALKNSGLVLAVLLSSAASTMAQTASLPQLGKASVQEVVAALTSEEKVKLVLGMGNTLSSVPVGMVLPPGTFPRMDSLDVLTPEKVSGAAGSTHAVPRLGIPSLTFSDGPAGVRINPTRPGDARKYYATAFPVATLLASSWDTALVRQVGRAFGNEVRAFGVDVLLAPGMNIHRNPLGGRNFEYYSEDPVVAGSMAAAVVQGVQSQGVGTSLKHFAANNQEFNRMKLNSRIGERALREIYLRGFELAVQRAQPWTVMSSYNKINGTYTSESRDLLTTILRGEWGFKGLVMSDWYGGKDPVAQLKAGNDLLMPGTLDQRLALLAALKDGRLTMAELDENVARMLSLVQRTPAFRGEKPSNAPDLQANAATARRAAAEGMVLLRNEGATLPLRAGQKIALFGNTSYDPIAGGTGSGEVNKAYTISIEQGLSRAAGLRVLPALPTAYRQYLAAEKAKLPKVRKLFAPVPIIGELPVPAALLSTQARAADVAVLTLGRTAGEGGDRPEAGDFTLRTAEREQLRRVASAFHAVGKKVVVVLNVGGVIEVASWRGLADAILLAWQPGQEGGYAVADLLGGRVNPSGKLSTTFPVKYADVPYAANYPGRELPGYPHSDADFFTGRPSENAYEEGIYVGYRYYGTFGVKPAYEFGYGLSYSSFGYGPLQLSAPTFAGQGLTATLTVTNTGRVAGKEVVQLYLSAPAGGLNKPARELKAFAKTRLLAPGQSQTLTFPLRPADLASYDPQAAAWVAAAGTYSVQVGASSQLIRQRASFQLPQALTTQKSAPLLVPQQPIAELPAPAATR